MNTGKIIKEIRKQKHISAETIAEAVGVHRATVYRWENGDIEKVPYQALIPIAKVLNVDPVDLLGVEPKDQSLECRLMTAFKKLTPEQQQAVILTVESMIK